MPDIRIPNFMVFILESNKAQEILEGMCEGAALSETLRFSGVRMQYHPVATKQQLFDELSAITTNPVVAQKLLLPVIHLAAHGGESGIQLTSKEVVSWAEFAQALLPLHRITNGFFLLCMSSCSGLGALNSMIRLPDPMSFGVVGTLETVDWSDNVIGFASFYHLLRRNRTIYEAVDGMKAASGWTAYRFVYGPDFYKVLHNQPS